jgi:amidophosphoribosyltransferase
MRSSSPPITHSCFYGIATPDRSKLIAAQMDTAGTCKAIRADSLRHAKIEDLQNALKDLGADPKNFCFACFTGKYPTVV